MGLYGHKAIPKNHDLNACPPFLRRWGSLRAWLLWALSNMHVCHDPDIENPHLLQLFQANGISAPVYMGGVITPYGLPFTITRESADVISVTWHRKRGSDRFVRCIVRGTARSQKRALNRILLRLEAPEWYDDWQVVGQSQQMVKVM